MAERATPSASNVTTTTSSARSRIKRSTARPRHARANPNQLSFAWGGAREGAGRPARGPIVAERHRTRPALAHWFPVHVIARLDPSVRALGRRDAYATIQRAVKLSLARTNFRIVRLAIRQQRLELLVEADDKHALARGMQGFQVSAARAINRAARRSGNVFPDRYRMTILRTRGAARAALDGALPQGGATRAALQALPRRDAPRPTIHVPPRRDGAATPRRGAEHDEWIVLVAPVSAETAILIASLHRSATPS
jgi:hypothetical protein